MFAKQALAAAGLCLGLSMTSAQAADQLTASELRQLFPGTFTAVVKGYTVRIAAKPSGQLKGQAMGLTDTGRWSLHGSQLCISMNNWTGGRSSCSAVTAAGGWYRGDGVKFRKG